MSCTTLTVTTQPPPPSDQFSIVQESIYCIVNDQATRTVPVNTQFKVKYKAVNSGTSNVSGTVTIKLNDKVLATYTITVPPGSSEYTTTDSFSVSAPGKPKLCVNNACVDIEVTSGLPDFQKYLPWIIGGIAGLMVIVVLIAVLSRK